MVQCVEVLLELKGRVELLRMLAVMSLQAVSSKIVKFDLLQSMV